MKDFERYIALRDKFNLKTATAEEVAEYIRLYESGVYGTKEEELAKEHFNTNIPPTQAEIDANERVYAKVKAGMERDNVRRLPRTVTWLAAASVVLAVLVIGVWNYSSHGSKDVVVFGTMVIDGPGYVQLPDNSTVEISEGSRLAYNHETFLADRELTLSGKGFFEVTHDPAHPFRVRTGRVLTTVLGTSFVVSESPDFKFIDVTVITGKVTVGALGHPDKEFRTILPNQKLTVKTDSADQRLFFSTNEHADVQAEMKFKENNIILKEVTLQEAVVFLEKRFGVTIHVENELILNCRLSLTFVRGETLKEILDYISPYFDATSAIDGNHVMIRGGTPCDPTN